MRVPTYLKEENYKILKYEEMSKETSSITLQIFTKEASGLHHDYFEIYYYGASLSGELIHEYFDKSSQKIVPCKVVAKCLHTEQEILLYDQARYGYNSLFCDEFNKKLTSERQLKKLALPPSKIELTLTYNIDYEEEKEDFGFDETDTIETINGEEITFEDVKKDGFDYLKIVAIDKEKSERLIAEFELA